MLEWDFYVAFDNVSGETVQLTKRQKALILSALLLMEREGFDLSNTAYDEDELQKEIAEIYFRLE